MNKYHKVLAFFSYLISFVALVAIIVDDRKNRLYSFYIWQAFLLHLVVGVLASVAYAYFLPRYILTLDVSLRTPVFLKLTIIPLGVFMLLILAFGIMSSMGVKFNIPLIGGLSKKIACYKE